MHSSPSKNSMLILSTIESTGVCGGLLDHKVASHHGISSHFIPTGWSFQPARAGHEKTDGLSPLLQPEDAEVFRERLVCFAGKPEIAAIKIGLIPSAAIAKVLIEFLSQNEVFSVFDPVSHSSLGQSFVDGALLGEYRKLARLCTIVTPNQREASQLWQESWKADNWLEYAERNNLPQNVLIKGGHESSCSSSGYASDFLIYSVPSTNGEGNGLRMAYGFSGPRLEGDTRGTGCMLSTTIACQWVKSQNLLDAVAFAKNYTATMMSRSWLNPNTGRLEFKSYALKNDWQFNPRIEVVSPAKNEESSLGLSMAMEGKRFKPAAQPIGLYPIVSTLEDLETCFAGGVEFCQLRVKHLDNSQAYELAGRAKAIANRYEQAKLILNDYWRAACELKLYGIHLGQEDLDTADLVAIAQAGIRLGISTHSYFELFRAIQLRPSYIALGPIFETTCKSMAFGPQGFEKITAWHNLARDDQGQAIPIVAIGGLKLDHVKELNQTPASGIAVLSDLVSHPRDDLGTRIKMWQNELLDNR